MLRFRDSLVVRVNPKPGAPRVALVGHTDVVRTQHDGPARIDGDRLHGAGAADMKSGLAVMIELAERLDRKQLPCDLTLVFYEREEGPYAENKISRNEEGGYSAVTKAKKDRRGMIYDDLTETGKYS